METRGMNERIRKLRTQSLTAEPRLSMERAELVTAVYEKYSGTVETPILRALAFKHIMEEKALCINDGELIVGEKGETPQSAPTFPELCCHSLDDMAVMQQRDKIYFRVTAEAEKIQREKIIPYWQNRAMRKNILDRMAPAWMDCYESGIFTEFMEQRGPGHTVIDGKIYKKGFLDFKADIEREISNLNFLADEQAYDKKIQLEAMVICCDAIITYGKRYARYARELAAAESGQTRKAELWQIAANCEVVPAHKPATFAQAIQMYWFVHIGVTTEINPWDALSPGRLDQHLYPFYQQGIEAGSLTREQAKELLQCLWIKFNNQPAPPKVGITLKESGTYTDFANLNTGGVKADGSDGVNDISYLILETMDELKLLQPSSNVQISRKSPHLFVKKACEISRKGWGQPAFYNTEAIIQELLRAGKDIVDARQGGASGCVETGAFGKEAYILTGYFNLPKILELTLNNGFDPTVNKQLGLETGHAEDYKSYEELFAAYKKQLQYFVDVKVTGNHIIETLYAKHMPVPFLSVIISDCIKKAKDYNAGGARYNTNYIQGVGIGTLADSLAAIKYNVFDRKSFTMTELMQALADNFTGRKYIHNLVLNRTPKYGNDDDYADQIMIEAFEAFYQAVTGRKNRKGGVYRIDMLPTTCHIYFGSVMGASPNGRRAHKPLSEGISPDKGADRKGPTAVIKSASKMDHIKTGGTLLNQKFTPAVVAGEAGLENMAALIRTYFNLDGHHIQFNVIDRKTLLAAQSQPEEYKDLIVRVAGYSDYFHNLDKELQDEIIARTEQSF
ncbi:MAG TPA: glycyl radical protein [Methylomusa anaerophila]|uniref:Benzylsuccinate synthase alpha subunit n=1 Tax=Methylomusa anaerophila TaxID=1930071 RepID=A0A348ALX8_9FIRM|nr:trans-4-hydroxy-L-proline dehydratase [Methylomusa anaerophila]BBB92076.1 benzylsuccinate synthase alpha subunit [Methylomusa anaerophila]HML87911.1 glycyl radical protein [Methylomusa anaerophila]